jgi:DNA-binding CsgD family transcriptional regulator
MIHLASAVHFLSTATGWAAVIVCFLLYAKHRKPFILYCLLFAAALTTMLVGLAVDHYGRIAGVNTVPITVWCGALGGNLFIVVIPPLVHRLFGLPFGRAQWLGFGAADAIVALLSLAYLTFLPLPGLLVALQIFLFGAVGYGTVVGLINSRGIGAAESRRFVGIMFLTTVVFLPLLIADAVMGQLPFLPYNLSLPLFLLIVCAQIIAFAVLYLDQPAFAIGNRLTSHCVDRLRLTAREKEIAESLLDGLTNKEISEKLFISFKTVENHLYNIYQKSGVRNRVQLINLIHTNSAS